MSQTIIITRPMIGLCYMQVCAPKRTRTQDILDVCNRDNPSGTTGGWSKVIRTGVQKPVVCEDDPHRYHYLVAC